MPWPPLSLFQLQTPVHCFLINFSWSWRAFPFLFPLSHHRWTPAPYQTLLICFQSKKKTNSLQPDSSCMKRRKWDTAWKVDAAALKLAEINEGVWLTYTLQPLLNCLVMVKKGNKLASWIMYLYLVLSFWNIERLDGKDNSVSQLPSKSGNMLPKSLLVVVQMWWQVRKGHLPNFIPI